MSALGGTNVLQKVMGIEETHYGICLYYEEDSRLHKKLLLTGLHDGMLYKLYMQDYRKVTVELSKRWDSHSGFLLH